MEWLESLLEDALRVDDVFCFAFLSGVVFHSHGILNRYSLDAGAQKFLSSHGNSWAHFIDASHRADPLLPGPYILENGLLWKVSRLYEDTADAFTVGLRTISNERYYSKISMLIVLRL